MSLNLAVPNAQQPVVGAGGVPTRPYFTLFQNVVTNLQALSDQVGNVTTTPAESPISENANVVGAYSIYTQGTLKTGIVKVLLIGDVENAGNTQYYGSDGTGQKGWHAVSDAFDSTADVTLTVGADGVTTVGLSDSGVTAGTYGGDTVIPVVTVDPKGRVTEVTEAAITIPPQVFNRIDAAGDIRVAADGSLRITY